MRARQGGRWFRGVAAGAWGAAGAVLLTVSAARAETFVGGLILEDTTWTAAESPYVVTSQLVVGGGAVLTIEPGVTVRIGSGLSVLIGSTAFGGATFVARGTADLPVVITSDSGSPHAGDWAQLVLGDDLVDATIDPDTGEYVGGSIVEHCSIGFGGGANATSAFRIYRCAPALADLTIHDMASQGVLLYPPAGVAMHLRDCGFLRINAPLANGGALQIQGENAPHRFERCRFEDNVGNWGGAVYAYPEGAAFVECTFRNNRSTVYGGAVYCAKRFQTFERCTFEDNSTTREGGAVWSTDGWLTFTDCAFVGNFVDDGLAEGGALQIDGGVSTLLRCSFIGNAARASSAHATGGAVRIWTSGGGKSLIEDCFFSGNSVYSDDALAGGGAVYCGDTDLIGNTFVGNTASGRAAQARPEGGAVKFHGQAARFEGNAFEDNEATGALPRGGGAYVESLGCHLIGNSFVGNVCSEQGGGLYLYSRCSLAGDPDSGVMNTFLDNQAGTGSALYNGAPYDANGRNDIDASWVCWGTTDFAEIAGMIQDFFDEPTLSVVGFAPPADCAGECIADWDGDGFVNTLDFLAFLNAWVAQEAESDVNGDGVINTLDFLAFLNLWTAGC